MELVDLQLLRKNGAYWEATAEYLALFKDMALRGRMCGVQAANYLVAPSADVRNTAWLFLLP